MWVLFRKEKKISVLKNVSFILKNWFQLTWSAGSWAWWNHCGSRFRLIGRKEGRKDEEGGGKKNKKGIHTLDQAPGILAGTNLLAIYLILFVWANNSKGHGSLKEIEEEQWWERSKKKRKKKEKSKPADRCRASWSRRHRRPQIQCCKRWSCGTQGPQGCASWRHSSPPRRGCQPWQWREWCSPARGASSRNRCREPSGCLSWKGEEKTIVAGSEGKRNKNKTKANILVASGGHKVQAAVNAVIDNVLAVHTTLLIKVGVIPLLNTLQNGLPAGSYFFPIKIRFFSFKNFLGSVNADLSPLFKRSPKPTASSTLSFSFTPPSSRSEHQIFIIRKRKIRKRKKKKEKYRSCIPESGPAGESPWKEPWGISLGRSECWRGCWQRWPCQVQTHLWDKERNGRNEIFDAFQKDKNKKRKKENDIPTTSKVNWNPCLMDLRCTWLGRLAKPTKPESFFYLSRNKGFWSNSFQKFKKKKKRKRSNLQLHRACWFWQRLNNLNRKKISSIEILILMIFCFYFLFFIFYFYFVVVGDHLVDLLSNNSTIIL